jgi:hypothetical protein
MVTNSTEYMRKYYENNKNKMKQQMKSRQQEQIFCKSCQKAIAKGNINSHHKTKIHLKNSQLKPDNTKLKSTIEEIEEINLTIKNNIKKLMKLKNDSIDQLNLYDSDQNKFKYNTDTDSDDE